MTWPLKRRQFLSHAVSAAAVAAAPVSGLAQSRPRVAVIGGGFGGVSFARSLRALVPQARITLFEPSAAYVSCPFSNLVLGGLRSLAQQTFSYDAISITGIEIIRESAWDIDPVAKEVRTQTGTRVRYDKLVMSPGIDLRFDALAGYDADAPALMPHAWKAGAQTALLRKQLEDMEDGGLVVISAPANPYRCPPGPYERASMIAHYLKTEKPRSKLLILDAKDSFSKQGLFQSAWREIYGELVEWVGFSDGGQVISVDPSTMTVETDFDRYTPAVANIIPPQRAAAIAQRAGVASATGWCPIDPVSFESRLQPDIHVLGDAAIANAMPKSAFAANAQAKVCAIQIARLFRGEAPVEATLMNTCYSLIAPDHAISVAGVYQPGQNALEEVPGSGGVSPAQADPAFRAREALYAADWFDVLTTQVFG